jgi:hypothetical protein
MQKGLREFVCLVARNAIDGLRHEGLFIFVGGFLMLNAVVFFTELVIMFNLVPSSADRLTILFVGGELAFVAMAVTFLTIPTVSFIRRNLSRGTSPVTKKTTQHAKVAQQESERKVRQQRSQHAL